MPQGAPPQTAVKSYPTPNIHDDVVLTELWNTENAGCPWQPQDPGTPHPNTRDYPGFKLARMGAIPGQKNWIHRIWVTDASNQDLYNYALKYVAEANAYPIFIRSYQELRATYAPRTKGAALQTVYRLTLTAAGSGYTTPPTVTFSGGAGSGAKAEALLNQDGTLAAVVLLAGGLSYTSAPTVTITGGGGSGATATAFIQPSGAILVSEEMQNYDPQDPNFNLYVHVMRVYKTLPGPLLLGAVQNPSGTSGVISRQEVAYGATNTITGPDVLESSVTPTSSVEAVLSGRTGALWENDAGGVVVWGIEGTVAEGVASAPSVATGIDVESSEAQADGPGRFHNKTVTVPWSETTVSYKDVGRRGYVASATRTWSDPSAGITSEAYNTEVERSLESAVKAHDDVLVYSDGSPIKRVAFDEFGGLETTTDTYVDPSTTPAKTGSHTQELIQEREHIARLIDVLSTTAGTHQIEIDLVDETIPGSRATKDYYLVVASTTIPADTGHITYARRRYPKNTTQAIEIKTTYVVPPDFQEYEDQGMAFPGIFLAAFIDPVFGFLYQARHSYSRVVPHHIFHSFGTTLTAVSTTKIQEAVWNIFGFAGSGLTDADPYTITSGLHSYSFTLPTSTPSRTAYSALVGTEITVGGRCVRWRADIFHLETVKVVAE